MTIDGTAIVLGLILLVAIIWAAAELRLELLPRFSGMDATATITKLERTSSARGSTYTVEYRFSADSSRQPSGEYARRQSVSAKHFRMLSMGASVPIRYWPQNPAVSQLAGEYTDHSSRNLSLFIVGFILVLLIISITKPFRQ